MTTGLYTMFSIMAGIIVIPITIYLLVLYVFARNKLATMFHDFRKILVLRRPIATVTQNFFFMLALIVLAVGYTYLAYRGENVMMPKWGELWIGVKNLYTDTRNGEHILWDDTIASYSRLIPAVLIASVIGITIGLYMGVLTAVESFFGRIMEFVSNVQPNAMMMVFLALFGFEQKMYIAVMVFGILPAITKGAYLIGKAVSNEHIYGVKTLGASNQEVVWSTVFKMTYPQLLEVIRQSVSPAIVYLIGAEWVTGTTGFGHRFAKLYHSARMNVMFPYLIYMGLMGILISILFKFAQRKLAKWYSEETK